MGFLDAAARKINIQPAQGNSAIMLSDGSAFEDFTVYGKKSGSVTGKQLTELFQKSTGRMPTKEELDGMKSSFRETNRLESGTIQGVVDHFSKQVKDTQADITRTLTETLGRKPTPEEVVKFESDNMINSTSSPEDKLAAIESASRIALAEKQKKQIEEFGKSYTTAADDYRTRLAERLAGYQSDLEKRNQEELAAYSNDLANSRQKTFEQANPFILEDLNRRGLFNSETAVTGAQAEALKKLQAEDEGKMAAARLGLYEDSNAFADQTQNTLTGFDTAAFGEGQDIMGEGLNTLLGGDQSALDAALELRRGKLQRSYDLADAAAERDYASSLARKQRRNATLNAGIGAAGSVATGGKGS